jgi:hypothetical protein
MKAAKVRVTSLIMDTSLAPSPMESVMARGTVSCFTRATYKRLIAWLSTYTDSHTHAYIHQEAFGEKEEDHICILTQIHTRMHTYT